MTSATKPSESRAGYGLVLEVHRHQPSRDRWDTTTGDPSNGGITSGHDKLTVVGIVDYRDPDDSRDKPSVAAMPRQARHRLPGDDAPPVWLVIRADGDRYFLPGDLATGLPDARTGWMDGGSFAASSDDRWTRVIGHSVALRVHDRREW